MNSHGRAPVAMLEGMVAGVPITSEEIRLASSARISRFCPAQSYQFQQFESDVDR